MRVPWQHVGRQLAAAKPKEPAVNPDDLRAVLGDYSAEMVLPALAVVQQRSHDGLDDVRRVRHGA